MQTTDIKLLIGQSIFHGTHTYTCLKTQARVTEPLRFNHQILSYFFVATHYRLTHVLLAASYIKNTIATPEFRLFYINNAESRYSTNQFKLTIKYIYTITNNQQFDFNTDCYHGEHIWKTGAARRSWLFLSDRL